MKYFLNQSKLNIIKTITIQLPNTSSTQINTLTQPISNFNISIESTPSTYINDIINQSPTITVKTTINPSIY